MAPGGDGVSGRRVVTAILRVKTECVLLVCDDEHLQGGLWDGKTRVPRHDRAIRLVAGFLF